MNSPAEIRQLADQRLLEAKLLLANGGIIFFEGVYYLAGYCVELYLKAKICESLDLDDLFSDTSTAKKTAGTFKSHRLEELMLVSGLSKKFEIAKAPNLPLANPGRTLPNGMKANGTYPWELSPAPKQKNSLNQSNTIKTDFYNGYDCTEVRTN